MYDDRKFESKNGTCCAGADIRDARSVARKLNISHQIINLESPEGHFGRLRSPIILERLIKEAKKNERKLEDVRLQEKARQL